MKDPFRILIVEDELLIAEMLREMLRELGYHVIGIARNYPAALSFLGNRNDIDLCFVDIHLEDEKSGFDVVKTIREQYFVPFVFLTSYSDKKSITDAAAFHPEAYLVKPFSQTDLLTTVEIIRSRRMQQKPEEEKIVYIKDGSLTVKVSRDKILWLKSDNIYVEVKTAAKTYLVRTSLERFLEELNDAAFVRVHRSFAVNIHHVEAVSGQQLHIGAERIPLSRKYRDAIHAQFDS